MGFIVYNAPVGMPPQPASICRHPGGSCHSWQAKLFGHAMGSSCKTLSAIHRTSDHVGPCRTRTVASESTLIRVWHVLQRRCSLCPQPAGLKGIGQPSEEPHLLKAWSLNIQDILLRSWHKSAVLPDRQT